MRPGYNQGMDDAYFGEPMRENGDEEYYMAYRQFSREDERQPEPSYERCDVCPDRDRCEPDKELCR